MIVGAGFQPALTGALKGRPYVRVVAAALLLREPVPMACEKISQAIVRASERQVVPRDLRRLELGALEALVVYAQRSADRGRGIDDDHRRAAGVRVDVDHAVEPHVEAALFARFANRRGGERLAAVDVAAGKYPLAIARLDRAAHQHEPAAARFDDRADGDFRIDVEDEAAARAHRTLGFGRLQQPPLERAAAPRTEAVG